MLKYKGIDEYFTDDPDAEKFCKEHGIVYFEPSPKRMKWLKKWVKTAKLPVIECEPDTECWFRAYGVWGQYHPSDNCISICPFEIERAGGLESVIRHELTHIQHPEADNMPHEEKEKYIEENDNNNALRTNRTT